MLKMFTEAIFVLPACINIEYLWFMLAAGFIFFSPLSLTPVFFCILYYFLFVQSFSCLCTQWLECAFTDSSKLCTVWPWAHGSVDGGFSPPLWHQVTCPPSPLPPPPQVQSLYLPWLSNLCAFCVYHGNYCIFQKPPPLNRIKSEIIFAVYFLGVCELAWFDSFTVTASGSIHIVCSSCLHPTQRTDDWDPLEESTHHEKSNV